MTGKIIITIGFIVFLMLAGFFYKHDNDERYRKVSDNIAMAILIAIGAFVVIAGIAGVIMLLKG